MSELKNSKQKERSGSTGEKRVSFDLSSEEPKRQRTPPAKLERQKVVPIPLFPGGKRTDIELMDLPDRFLFHIFGYLKPFDWCRASGVCKQWKNLLYSDRLWHSAFILKWPQKASDPKHYYLKEKKKEKKDSARNENQTSSSRQRSILTITSKDREKNVIDLRSKSSRTSFLRRKANSVTSSSYDFETESATTNSSVELDIDQDSLDLETSGSGSTRRTSTSGDPGKKTKSSTTPFTSNEGSRRGSLSTSGTDDTLLRNIFKSIPEVDVLEETSLDDFLSTPLSRILSSSSQSAHESTNRMTKTRNELLIWVNQQLAPFKSFVTVQSLEDFFDGRALLALIHKYDPNSINLKEFDTSDKRKTFQIALDLAEKYMNIPNLLNIDSVISGKNNRSLLLYLCLFKFRFDELERKNNPLASVRHEINELKSLLTEQIKGIELTKKEFDEDCNRLCALTSNETLEEEHKYYEQRAQMMDKIVLSAKETINTLLTQNKRLTEQNIALQDKVKALEKMLQIEEERRKRAEDELLLEEKIKGLGKLLDGKDIAQYLKENADSLTKMINDESVKTLTESNSLQNLSSNNNTNSNNNNNSNSGPFSNKTLVFL